MQRAFVHQATSPAGLSCGLLSTLYFLAVLAAIFGIPERSGGGINHESLGFIRPWVSYRRDDCQLRFEFDIDDRIRMVTVLERDWEPGN